MSVSEKSSTQSAKKKNSSIPLPCVKPRPGNYIKIVEFKPCGASTPVECNQYDDFDPNCKCKSPICKEHRGGGTILKLTPPQDNDMNNMESFNFNKNDVTRDWRVASAALQMTGDSKCCDTTESEEDTSTEEENHINSLGIVFSVLMFIATETSPPPPLPHINTTIRVLNMFRDERNNLPPNIQGFLNHLALLMEGTDDSTENAGEEEAAA